MADDLTSEIQEAAAAPKKVSGDAGSVEAHSLGELVEADRHLASKGAAKGRNRGLRFQKLSPPGTA